MQEEAEGRSRRSLHVEKAWLFFFHGQLFCLLRLGHALRENDGDRTTDEPEKNISDDGRAHVGEQRDKEDGQVAGQETQEARGRAASISCCRMPHMTTSTFGGGRKSASLM